MEREGGEKKEKEKEKNTKVIPNSASQVWLEALEERV